MNVDFFWLNSGTFTEKLDLFGKGADLFTEKVDPFPQVGGSSEPTEPPLGMGQMQKENILTAWQTPVSVRALIGWLQVRGYRFKSWIFSSFTSFSNMLCAVKLRVLGLMAYWYTGSAFHQIPQS